jgi:magnesium transporter
MRETVVQSSEPPLSWVDVTDPSSDELAAIAREYHLHPVAVKDCLDPTHLPKYERQGPLGFVIVRAFDAEAGPDADNVREATRKVALFVGRDVLLTIHRKPQGYLDAVKERASAVMAGAERPAHALAAAIIEGALQTFRPPMQAAEHAVEAFEERLFEGEDLTQVIRQVYVTKRRISITKWTMRHTRDVIEAFSPDTLPGPVLQNLKETADQLYFIADELLEDVNQLLNLHLSMAAHRTNQVITVLTVFSAFFLPLTFIVGIYGMNFQFIPEIHVLGRWGYPFSWVLMIGASAAIAIWFRRKGWL